MLPPVLEIYVVWHPRDTSGKDIAERLADHFHGTIFSGLIGGAVEVYVRSCGWSDDEDAPRPIPWGPQDSPADVREAHFVAVVPLVGNELAAAVESSGGPWFEYIRAIRKRHDIEPERIVLFPYLLDSGALDGTVVGDNLSKFQCVGVGPMGNGDSESELLCRDLGQGLSQMLSTGDSPRLKVFISHTKRNSPGEEKEDVDALISCVRSVIAETRLQEFFDASDLQPGSDWDTELRSNAKTSALLAIRTDLYASREWCQREILIAKRAGMPVIIMDALGEAEERGSFLMDHVPRVPARSKGGQWNRSDVYRALNLLVDESLKRNVWEHQKVLAEELHLPVAWWAPHAPEPITLISWLDEVRKNGALPDGDDFYILHPDPPLGPEELKVLNELLLVSGFSRGLDVMTPRSLAARVD